MKIIQMENKFYLHLFRSCTLNEYFPRYFQFFSKQHASHHWVRLFGQFRCVPFSDSEQISLEQWTYRACLTFLYYPWFFIFWITVCKIPIIYENAISDAIFFINLKQKYKFCSSSTNINILFEWYAIWKIPEIHR